MSDLSAKIIETLAGEFARNIYVTKDVLTRQVKYNGHNTLFEVMINNPLFREMDSAGQMLMLALVANDVEPLMEPDLMSDEWESTRTFMYSHFWVSSKNDHICLITQIPSGEVLYEDYFKNLHNEGILANLDDVDGMINFLVNYDYLHQGDVVRAKLNDQKGIGFDGTNFDDPFDLY